MKAEFPDSDQGLREHLWPRVEAPPVLRGVQGPVLMPHWAEEHRGHGLKTFGLGQNSNSRPGRHLFGGLFYSGDLV